ncbi:hypothetical protein D3C86_984940 [compost metagenome]
MQWTGTNQTSEQGHIVIMHRGQLVMRQIAGPGTACSGQLEQNSIDLGWLGHVTSNTAHLQQTLNHGVLDVNIDVG